ncbi:MAG: acetyl-CoA decarbonylase/synthase complex subunit delta [bacterium]
MPVELVKDSWKSKIAEVTIGATKDEGGTRTSVVKIGGETTMPYLIDEGEMPNKPVVAMEVWDVQPPEMTDELKAVFGDVYDDPAKWAKKCVDEYGAEAIYLRLIGCHPDWGDKDATHAVESVKKVLSAVGVPLIIMGSGNDEKDNAVMPKVSQAAKGEKCLLGDIKESNYKVLAASSIADGHSVIAEAPLDINIGKQVSILATDLGMPEGRMVLYETNGALGYGLEYAYSIMERARIAGLGGDKMLAVPLVVVLSTETMRAKESKAPEADFPTWGDVKKRGIMWEALGATTYLLAGADLLIMWHPEAVRIVKNTISELMKK